MKTKARMRQAICIVCSDDFEYEYKGGRNRRTCDNPECQNTRANFTRKRSRSRAKGELSDDEYPTQYRRINVSEQAGEYKKMTEKELDQLADSHDQWLNHNLNRRTSGPKLEATDVDMEGWEATADQYMEERSEEADGGDVAGFGDLEVSAPDSEPDATDGWVPKFRRREFPDGYSLDDWRGDPRQAESVIPKDKLKAIADWYARNADTAPPITVEPVGRTASDARARELAIKGSADRSEPRKVVDRPAEESDPRPPLVIHPELKVPWVAKPEPKPPFNYLGLKSFLNIHSSE